MTCVDINLIFTVISNCFIANLVIANIKSDRLFCFYFDFPGIVPNMAMTSGWKQKEI